MFFDLKQRPSVERAPLVDAHHKLGTGYDLRLASELRSLHAQDILTRSRTTWALERCLGPLRVVADHETVCSSQRQRLG